MRCEGETENEPLIGPSSAGLHIKTLASSSYRFHYRVLLEIQPCRPQQVVSESRKADSALSGARDRRQSLIDQTRGGVCHPRTRQLRQSERRCQEATMTCSPEEISEGSAGTRGPSRVERR